MQRRRDYHVEPAGVFKDFEHEGRHQPIDDPRVSSVLESMDDLFPYAFVPQWGSGALEAEVHVLAIFADEGLEGRWHPATAAHGPIYQGQSLEAFATEQVVRPAFAADTTLRVEKVG